VHFVSCNLGSTGTFL